MRCPKPSLGWGGAGLSAWKRGFTLIELMIVIGIAAIIVAAGIPPFVNAMRKDGLRKAVSDVVEGCSHARAQAILNGVPMELVIRAGDGEIAVRQAEDRGGAEAPDEGLFPSEPGPARSVPSTFRSHLPEDIAVTLLAVNFQDQMDALEARVRFFPNGTSDEFTILLASTSGEQQISLDIITGLAEVKVLR
ncbi:MAG: GspH/FimT family pseudopilin [Verrucomicrobiia bacterium]